MCMTPEERKDHCILAHKFPHNFRFDLMPKKKNVKEVKGAKESEDGNDGCVESSMEAAIENAETICNSSPADVVKRTAKPLKTINFGHTQSKSFNSDTNYAKVLTKNQSKTKPKTRVFDDNKMVVDLISSLPE